MFSSITWGQYLSVIAIALTGYYIYVAYKYFLWEVLGLIGIKKIEKENPAIAIADLKKQFTANNHSDYLPKETSLATQPLLDELAAYLNEMNAAAPSEEILFAIESIAAKYPALTDAKNNHSLTEKVAQLVHQYFPNKILAEDIQTIFH